MEARERRTGRLPATVLALGMTSFFTDVGSEMIFPLLPAFLAGLGAAMPWIGLIEGAADATASFLKLAFGYVVDRAPRKKPFVLLGYGIAAFARPWVALASAPWHVLAVRVSDRVGKGIRTAPRDAMLASSVSGDQAGRAFGFHRAMDHAGAVVGPLVAMGLLALGWDIRAVFLAAVVPGILSLVAAGLAREVRDASESEKTTAASTVGKTRLSGRLRSYLLILGVFALGNSSDAFLLLRARELGVSLASTALLWAAFHVVKALSSYFAGGLADRVPRTRLIIAGWVLYAAVYSGFAMVREAWQVWALFLVYGLYYGMTEPAEKALVRDLAPTNARGRAFGAYAFVLGAAAIPAGVLTGWMWEVASSTVALALGAGLALAAAVLMALWARREPASATA